MALTDKQLKAATVPEGKQQTKLSDGAGMYLLVKASGKYWRLGYRFDGKQRTLALGVYPSVSLKAARAKRDAAKKLLAQHIDPHTSKQADKIKAEAASKADTFRGVATEWIEMKKVQWVTTTYKHKQADLANHIFPWLGDMKLSSIEPVDVLSVCKRIENSGHNEAAHRAKMLCSQILRYGVATGRLKSDPTRDLHGALAPVITTHRPCLKDSKEVGGLMRAIKGHKGTFIVHSALLLAPYVMLRPVELRQLEWQEIDFAASTLTIPAHKMKMRQIHIVPLSDQAIAILQDIRALTGRGRYVFHGARDTHRPMSDAAINAALRQLGYDTKTQHCAHGFRGMASTLLHGQGFNSDFIERQLAHKEGNAIKAAYNHARHLPERTAMMQQWADYLDRLRDGADVISINRAI